MSRLTVTSEQKNDPTPTNKYRDQSPSLSRFNSWVVVGSCQWTLSRSRESSPVRKKSKASTASLYAAPSPAPRHSSHILSRPRLTPRSSTGRSSASYASPRIPLGADLASQPQARRSTSSLPTPEPHNSAEKSMERPSSSHTRSSIAPIHSRRTSTHDLSTPPKQSPEVKKFEQKLRKKAAKQDQSMSKFNDRLQAMIREGQAALGSRVEVEMGDDEDVDEGYYEDGDGKFYAGHGRWS